jgi:hypothetical protein
MASLQTVATDVRHKDGTYDNVKDLIYGIIDKVLFPPWVPWKVCSTLLLDQRVYHSLSLQLQTFPSLSPIVVCGGTCLGVMGLSVCYLRNPDVMIVTGQAEQMTARPSCTLSPGYKTYLKHVNSVFGDVDESPIRTKCRFEFPAIRS